MELEGCLGKTVYVRASEIQFVADGSMERPLNVLAPTPRTLVHANGNPSAAEGKPATEKISTLGLIVRGNPNPQWCLDTPANREKIDEALNAATY